MRGGVVVFGALLLFILVFGHTGLAADPAEVRGPIDLIAAYDSGAGRNAFFFNGKPVPPTVRALPGDVIDLTFLNNLPAPSSEKCALGLCANHSNLHFHGLHVSPNSPQHDVDDNGDAGRKPEVSRRNTVLCPAGGLYWYHTHPHGESARQDLDGMSGAIVIDGIDRYYPVLRNMRECVLVLRDRDLTSENVEARSRLLHQVEVAAEHCGTSSGNTPERIFTVNGEVRPQLPIRPGERQFWRIVNTSPDRYADIQIDRQQLEIVALDGMPLSYHDRTMHTRKVDHLLLAPAGRLEAIVTDPQREQRN